MNGGQVRREIVTVFIPYKCVFLHTDANSQDPFGPN